MNSQIYINTKCVPENLKHISGKSVDLEISCTKNSNHLCYLSSCAIGSPSYAPAAISPLQYKQAVKAGASKKREVAKKDEMHPIDIKVIGDNILKTLHDEYVTMGKTISDNVIVGLINKHLNTQRINFSRGETDMLIQYIRNNLSSLFKESIMVSHPLFQLIKQRGKMLEYTTSLNYSQNHDQLVAITRHISTNWRGIQNLKHLTKPLSFGQDNIIHPLFVLLFGLKMPGFEDLVISQDYLTMLKDLATDRFNKDNMMLLWLRTADTALLPTRDVDHSENLNNENLRVRISVMLRELSYKIRTGIFNSEISNKLLKILSHIVMPDTSFEEENFLHAIFATFSFKPTLLARTHQAVQPFALMGNSSDFVPSAVYTIQYPISDFMLTQGNRPFLSELNFKDIGYDPLRKKVIFMYSDQNQLSDEQLLLTNILKNLGTQTAEANIYDALPTLVTRAGILPDVYENIKKTKILLTNGLFCVSVPRYEKRLFGGPDFSFFRNSNLSEGYNLTPIIISPKITVHNKDYELCGALCYDIIEHSDLPDFVPKYLKIGTTALIKLDNGKWWEYNPQLYVLPERLDAKMRRLMEGKTNAEKTEIKNRILNGEFEAADMEIEEGEAMDKIQKCGCLLFYSENYEQYLARIRMAALGRTF
ncbi:putative P4b protein [Diachasmimorpha longicaudata entomopoxvirus]|uniref:Virion core protein 4b n=1 Tax=Diachasmimorpha longicaudata entomopoxvirus TaxID=109981 RepID=A0A7R5WS57_9POXV|nr:putative P4b protein [Diachasmimorpha longicaudata entomopoxvirus]AKS26438.1 putative P4b protein [Diachasmimorpha longicaudata entomopoxvirus]